MGYDVLRLTIRPRPRRFVPDTRSQRSMAGMRLASRNCLPSKVLRLAFEAAAFGILYAVACVPCFDG